MTLERHRSKLIPSVSLEADGKLSIGRSQGRQMTRDGPPGAPPGGGLYSGKGTPPRGRRGPPGAPPDGGNRLDPRALEDYDRYSDMYGRHGGLHGDEQSYRSYDPQRDAKLREKGKFKSRRPSGGGHAYADEINAMKYGGTWSSKGSGSTARKVRKKRQKQLRASADVANLHTGSQASLSRNSSTKRRGGTPKMHPDQGGYPGSLNRTRALKNVDLRTLKKAMKEESTYSNGYNKPNGQGLPLIMEIPQRNKKLTEEDVPWKMFVCLGLALLAVGLVHLLVSWWHLYGCHLWTGALLLALAYSGRTHKRDYLTKSINNRYILCAMLSTAGAMVCVWMNSKVAIQAIVGMSNDGRTKDDVAANISFTNMDKELAISSSVSTMLYVSIITEVTSVAVCFLSFYALSAAIICLDNHWEAVYKSTGQCDHRGHPGYFNPIEQMSLGQMTIFFGILAMLLMQADINHYYVHVWCGGIVVISGFVSLCQGKRIDVMRLSFLSMILQLLSMGACGGAVVVLTLSLVDDIEALREDPNPLTSTQEGERIAGAISAAILLITLMVNLILSVGISFRICRKNWCGRAFTDAPKGQGDNISIA